MLLYKAKTSLNLKRNILGRKKYRDQKMFIFLQNYKVLKTLSHSKNEMIISLMNHSFAYLHNNDLLVTRLMSCLNFRRVEVHHTLLLTIFQEWSSCLYNDQNCFRDFGFPMTKILPINQYLTSHQRCRCSTFDIFC